MRVSVEGAAVKRMCDCGCHQIAQASLSLAWSRLSLPGALVNVPKGRLESCDFGSDSEARGAATATEDDVLVT